MEINHRGYFGFMENYGVLRPSITEAGGSTTEATTDVGEQAMIATTEITQIPEDSSETPNT